MSRRRGQNFVRPNRRAFLRGVAGATVALPFLESLPERSAWAASAPKPVFGFFLCAVGGVVRSQFLPAATGPLTPAGLAAEAKATSALAAHADKLLLVSGIKWPPGSVMSDSHVDGLCAALTGKVPLVASGSAQAPRGAGPSADAFIASKAHPDRGPIALYAGNLKNGFAAERLSYSGPGTLVPVIDNPHTLYQQLVGLDRPTADELLLRSRKSVHDLVREELKTLMQSSRLGAADRQRLQLHFDSIRDVETTMTRVCSSEGLDTAKLAGLATFKYDAHRTDEMVGLHMSLVAMAFACNYRRAASLQWGDPYDRTIYDVPSNPSPQWIFTHISHRVQSDSAVGSDASNPTATQAHVEIDAARMKTLAAGLDHFKARGLADQCFVMWTNHYAEGPSHAFADIPHIIWGNGGGFLKQGLYVDAAGATNNRLLNTLISAALQDTGTVIDNFGDGTGGLLDAIRA